MKKITTFWSILKANFICNGHSQPKDKNLLAQFLLIADLHTDGDFYRDRNNKIRLSLAGLNQYASSNGDTAVIMAGDITNSAHIREYAILKKMIATYLKRCKVMPEMGNHDSRGTSIDPNFEEACLLFKDFLSFCGMPYDHCYYAFKFHGVYCIMLATEKLMKDEAYISEKQLEFLNKALHQAEEEGCPVILVNHQPLNDTNGVREKWPQGDFEQTEAVKKIVSAYTDRGMTVLLVTGHLHAPFSHHSFQQISPNFYALNPPAFLDKTGDQSGQGVMAKFYSNRIELQGYDFLKRKPLSFQHKIYF